MKQFLLLLTLVILQATKVNCINGTIRRLGGIEEHKNHFYRIMHNQDLTDPQKFYEIANSCDPVSDKVNLHRYQEMYGTYLLPYVRRQHFLKKKTKFLEIGLGCDSFYGTLIQE